jgi:integrase/recombinase XerD
MQVGLQIAIWLKYIHYFGNESSESLLEAYDIATKNNIPIDTLNPKICPNCNEGNTQDAKFCSKCKMIMSFDGYQEVRTVKERMASMENVLVAIQPLLQNIKPEMLTKLQLAGMNK